MYAYILFTYSSNIDGILQRDKTPATHTRTPTSVPRYGTKQFDDEAPVLEFWVMWNIPSLLLFPGPLSSLRALSMSLIELFDHLNCVQTNDWC